LGKGKKEEKREEKLTKTRNAVQDLQILPKGRERREKRDIEAPTKKGKEKKAYSIATPATR